MSKNLEAFQEGQLCYVVLRKYQGEGEPVLILHEADAIENNSFAYGAGRHWVLKPEIERYVEPSGPLSDAETKPEIKGN